VERERAELDAEMRRMAAEHLARELGKKRRKELLRERGYDPAGVAGDVYRAEWKKLRVGRGEGVGGGGEVGEGRRLDGRDRWCCEVGSGRGRPGRAEMVGRVGRRGVAGSGIAAGCGGVGAAVPVEAGSFEGSGRVPGQELAAARGRGGTHGGSGGGGYVEGRVGTWW
jgi:hypothetical protein